MVPSRNETILVVEDEQLIAKDLLHLLIDLGYRVPMTVASSDDAIRAVSEVRPDLVLMDIRLRGKRDGIETAMVIQETYDVPVIFLSAFADYDTLSRATATEPYGYLVKPVTSDELRAAIEIGLHKHKVNRELREQKKLMQIILESAGEGIIVANELGKIVLFNGTAERIIGMGKVDAEPEERVKIYGVFQPDRVTFLSPEETPLARAVRGESVDKCEIFMRNPNIPNGVYLSVTGRPLRDDRGKLKGGVVTFNDVTELRAAQERLAQLATTDGLTELANYRCFMERLTQLMAEGDRGRRFALVMIDIDHFKSINDAHGHQVGDEVLVLVARTLERNIRKTDFVARYAGDEFCVLFVDVDGEAARLLAEKLRKAIVNMGGPVGITASFGVCSYDSRFESDSSALIRGADEALYRAKHRGRDSVRTASLPD